MYGFLRTSEDFREGVDAWKEKHKKKFKGKEVGLSGSFACTVEGAFNKRPSTGWIFFSYTDRRTLARTGMY